LFDITAGKALLEPTPLASSPMWGQSVGLYAYESPNDDDFEGDDEDEEASVPVAPPDPLVLTPPSTVQGTIAKVGRNDPCPCGSGKKYKRCCGA